MAALNDEVKNGYERENLLNFKKIFIMGYACGPAGPTTSYRMDPYTPALLE
jgi:tartrate dehydratase beta subunit/fumarate hydratase class I family protein